jgi:hypothetical protein
MSEPETGANKSDDEQHDTNGAVPSRLWAWWYEWVTDPSGNAFQAIIAIATVVYAFYSAAQWGITRQALEASEAARLVMLTVAPGDISSPTGFTVTMEIQNIGRSEAFEITPLLHDVAIGRGDERPTFNVPNYSAVCWGAAMPPGDVYVWTWIPQRILTPKEVSAVSEREGGAWLYLYGTLRYYNGFSVAYLPFCWRYIHPDRWAADAVFKRRNKTEEEAEAKKESPFSVQSCPWPYP